jgi:hypothetical protein
VKLGKPDYSELLKQKHRRWIETRDPKDGDRFADAASVAHGWCPECRNIAVAYPDGRLTCLRCEWEDI